MKLNRLVAIGCWLFFCVSVLAGDQFFSAFKPEFLRELGYTSEIQQKLLENKLSEKELEKLTSFSQSKVKEIWQTKWHKQFDTPLGDEFELGEYELDNEKRRENLGETAARIELEMWFLAIHGRKELDALIGYREKRATAKVTVGDKVIYTILKKLNEDPREYFPPIEKWTRFSKSKNPIYRLIGLEAGVKAAPESLNVSNKNTLKDDSDATSIKLNKADLAHYSAFLDDPEPFIRQKAAGYIRSYVKMISIPEAIEKKIRKVED